MTVEATKHMPLASQFEGALQSKQPESCLLRGSNSQSPANATGRLIRTTGGYGYSAMSFAFKVDPNREVEPLLEMAYGAPDIRKGIGSYYRNEELMVGKEPARLYIKYAPKSSEVEVSIYGYRKESDAFATEAMREIIEELERLM